MSVWLWSVDTQDWMARLGFVVLGQSHHPARRTGGQGASPPVVLMHNQPAGNPATVSALPVIIRFFRSHGYRFVRV
jgi:peptidoglycan/xylan/chitin deacetylase (PgdA/CDA1 family)